MAVAMQWPQWCVASDNLDAHGPQAMAVAASPSRQSGARTMRRTVARARQRGLASRCARVPSPLAKDVNNLPQTVHTLLQVPLWLKAQVACAVGAAPAEAAQYSAHSSPSFLSSWTAE